LLATGATAQTSAPAEQTGATAQTSALAESLFRDGRTLLEQKRYAEACPKLAESARLEPSSGVQIALGLCYEAEGKTASAWGAYSAVVWLARRDARPDREHLATKRLAALENKVSHVTYVVPREVAALGGLELLEDGAKLASVAWDGAPVDPGAHQVEVRAPGYVTYTTSFNVEGEASASTVVIPALTPARAAPADVPGGGARAGLESPSTPHGHGASALRATSYVVTGAGIAAIVAGSVLGGVALAKANTVHDHCPASRCTSDADISENDTAGTLADASTTTFIAGGALVATGVVMLLLSPSQPVRDQPRRASTWTPVLGPGYGGLRCAF
jgi:hypothetical protein